MYQSTSDNWDAEGYDFDMHVVGAELNDPNDASLHYQQFILNRLN